MMSVPRSVSNRSFGTVAKDRQLMSSSIFGTAGFAPQALAMAVFRGGEGQDPEIRCIPGI